MTEAEIRKAFCDEGLRQYIALSYDFDIAPMLASGNAQFATLTGDTVAETVSELAKSELLRSAKSIVLNIVFSPTTGLRIRDLDPLSDLLSSLPDDMEVIWGMASSPSQPDNITLNLLTKSSRGERE